MSCDWAYWYLPDSRTVRPARVTLRSRGRVADTDARAGEVRGGGRGEGVGQRQGRGSGKSINKSVERPIDDTKEIEKEKVDDKPWRKFMKKPSVDLPATDDTVEVVKEPEKPWRVNMKAKARKEEEKSSDAALPSVEKEDRPWRANMKKDSSRGEAVKEPVVKKRHYDRKEVKEFMKAKRAKEKEEKEEKEREEELRKARIAGRLRELEQLQRAMTKAEVEEMRGLGQDGKLGQEVAALGREVRKEKKLSPEGQELLRQKLLELTEQMKEQWRARRGKTVTSERSLTREISLVEEVYRKSDTRESDENNINIVSEQLDSSRKVSAKESLKVTTRVEEKLSLCDSLPPRAQTSLSDISDATEIRSLSDRLERSDRSGEGRASRVQGTPEGMRWSKRLSSSAREAGNTLVNLSSPVLTDEVPERDLSDRESSREVVARHQEELRQIRASVAEHHIDVSPPGLEPAVFQPRYPSVLAHSLLPPPSQEVPGRESSPLPVPRPQSLDTGAESDLPPVWMEVTQNMEEPGDNLSATRYREQGTAANLSATRYREQVPGGNMSSTRFRELGPGENLSATSSRELGLGENLSATGFRELGGNLSTTRSREPELGENLSATRYRDPPKRTADPFNFITTVTRKYELASSEAEMQVSEGVLSPSSAASGHSLNSSLGSSRYAPVVDPRTYSKEPQVLGPRARRGRLVDTQSEQLPLETDSESTLRGVEDSIVRDSPRSAPPPRDRERKMKKKRSGSKSSSRSQESEPSRSHQAVTSVPNDDHISVPNSAQLTGGPPPALPPPQASSLPSALHLRFLTELHQLEAVTDTQRLVAELEQMKRAALEQNRGMEQVQGEVVRQQRRLEEQEGQARLAAAQQQLQEIYSSKLTALLESQHEATAMTRDVARHLASLAAGSQEPPVLRELQALVEQLQGGAAPASAAGTTGSRVTASRTSVTTTEKSSETAVQLSSGDAPESSREEASSREETDGRLTSSIQVDPMSFASRTPSSILEVLDKHQAAGSSMEKTIAEALASISEADQRTGSNITAEVEEELSTDYSSQFEDESTLKEQSLKTLLPSESLRRKSAAALETRKSASLRRDLSTDASESSLHSEHEDEARPGSSLFSDNDSFTRFTLEMVSQYMLEEKVRAQHKASLLRIREKALIQEARQKVEQLERVRREIVDRGGDDKMPNIKKKQRSILHKLKERRAEIAGMRENLKVAERERRFMVQEQKQVMRRRQEGRAAATGESADQESDAPEDRIAKIEVLKGLKKLDKNRKTMTTKERKFKDMKDLSGIFDTSRAEESGSDVGQEAGKMVRSRGRQVDTSSEVDTDTGAASRDIRTASRVDTQISVTSLVDTDISAISVVDTEISVASVVDTDTRAASVVDTDTGASSNMSAVKKVTSVSQKIRHSSAESESRSLEDTTVTDVSDIEARIGALR